MDLELFKNNSVGGCLCSTEPSLESGLLRVGDYVIRHTSKYNIISSEASHLFSSLSRLTTPRGWCNVDPEPRVGGRVVQPKAKKKKVIPTILI